MCVVDLREVGRLERHRDAELRQRIGQFRAALVQQLAPCPGPWAAATTARPCSRAKARRRSTSAALSGSRWRSTSAVTLIAARPARSAGRSRARPSSRSARAAAAAASLTLRRHARGTRACRPRSGVLRSWKPTSTAALLAHVPHGQPGALAVAPGRALDGPQDALGLHLAQVPRGCLRARAASRPPAPRRAGAASCSRRRRPHAGRSAGSAAARAARSRGAGRSGCPAPSCSCARLTWTCTSSPGSAPSMNTTLPSARRATPCASRSSATQPPSGAASSVGQPDCLSRAATAARYSCQCGSSMRRPALHCTKAISCSYSTSVKPPRIFWKRQYSR